MAQEHKGFCHQCGDRLDPLTYSPNTKFCKKCAYNRVKGRGLARYYRGRGSVRVSVTISTQQKNYIEKNFIDLRGFLRAKLDEEMNKNSKNDV